MIASVSPRGIAGDSDRQEARKEQQRQEREARNAEKREEAARRHQEHEDRRAQKHERNEQERRERDEKRARDEEREARRQERAGEKQRERGEREARNLAQDEARERREKEKGQQRGADGESRRQKHGDSSDDRSARQNDGASRDNSASSDNRNRHGGTRYGVRREPERRENPEGRIGEVDRYVDKGGKKPPVESTPNQDRPIEERNGKLGRDDAPKQSTHVSRREQRKLDGMQRQLNENSSVQRLREFTPEQITEFKNNGKSAELNRYIKEGGRKPEIEVFDQKSGHWVTPPSTTGRVTVPLPSNTNKDPSQSRDALPALTPQPERYRGDLSGTHVFLSSNDQEWVAGLTRAQRRALDQYPHEQLVEIQKSGRWQGFKGQIEARGSEGAQWGALKSDQPNRFKSNARNTTANSTSAHPTPGTPDTGGMLLDGAQVGLGAAGLAPGVGIVPDLANSGISALRGDKAGAALDLAAAIPGTGGAAGAAGIARRVDKVINVAKSGTKGTPFENRLPQLLADELQEAARVGVVPIRVDNKAFAQVVNQGKIKFVVTKDGELLITPKWIDGKEVFSHAAIARGQPVLTAGEADIASVKGVIQGIEIWNDSGHYKPTLESLDIAREAFGRYGVTFPPPK